MEAKIYIENIVNWHYEHFTLLCESIDKLDTG